MTPLVSIVTTVYNRPACLARCLRSVKALDYPHVEHLVVSDCPPSAIRAEIAALCRQADVLHLNLPTRANDWGITPAAAGLRAATGTHVCFLSDDNIYLPDHLGPLVEALEADPGLGFVYSSCRYAGRKVLRACPPRCLEIDLGQPLFRRAVLGRTLPFHELCWDWRLISGLMRKGVRFRHLDHETFIFRAAEYPEYLEAYA